MASIAESVHTFITKVARLTGNNHNGNQRIDISIGET